MHNLESVLLEQAHILRDRPVPGMPLERRGPRLVEKRQMLEHVEAERRLERTLFERELKGTAALYVLGGSPQRALVAELERSPESALHVLALMVGSSGLVKPKFFRPGA